MARKISLREFQESVVAKLQNLAASEAANPSRLGVQVGSQLWLVKLSDISEVLPVPPQAAVPLAQPWFGGVANFRGNLYGIVDFCHFLGGAPTAPGVDCRVLLAHPKFMVNAGIVVSRMMGLRNPDQMQRVEAAGETQPWMGAAYRDEAGSLWQELDMQALTGHARFLNAGLG
ncbi:MAG: chemotaxis protein CheW [Sulfuricella sp.]|nr:chemotaxis protein CheW [Sulfuricella sp.]